MAEVYIDSLTLENFGPFYGEHTLELKVDGAGLDAYTFTFG